MKKGTQSTLNSVWQEASPQFVLFDDDDDGDYISLQNIFTPAISEYSSKKIVAQIVDQWFIRREPHTNSSKMFEKTEEMRRASNGNHVQASLSPISYFLLPCAFSVSTPSALTLEM